MAKEPLISYNGVSQTNSPLPQVFLHHVHRHRHRHRHHLPLVSLSDSYQL